MAMAIAVANLTYQGPFSMAFPWRFPRDLPRFPGRGLAPPGRGLGPGPRLGLHGGTRRASAGGPDHR